MNKNIARAYNFTNLISEENMYLVIPGKQYESESITEFQRFGFELTKESLCSAMLNEIKIG